LYDVINILAERFMAEWGNVPLDVTLSVEEEDVLLSGGHGHLK
jgi:hypothetical protein